MLLTGLGWIGAFALLVGIIHLLGALSRGGILSRIRSLLLAVVLLGIGLLSVGLSLALRSCEQFSTPTLVADVSCQVVGLRAFDLTLTPIRQGVRAAPQTFRLYGDQWTLSGGIVKWHPWLRAMGLPSYHKLSRISGRFANTADEIAARPSAFDLNGGLDRVWGWLYRLNPVLPFVETVYGSSVFAYADPAYVFEVSVTPSGYLLHRRPQAPLSERR